MRSALVSLLRTRTVYSIRRTFTHDPKIILATLRSRLLNSNLSSLPQKRRLENNEHSERTRASEEIELNA
jgi:hypothetical protein